jgi:hypothetical protein
MGASFLCLPDIGANVHSTLASLARSEFGTVVMA